MSTYEESVQASLAPLQGTTWRHRRKGGRYVVTKIDPCKGCVYLSAQDQGCRSTWKADCLLPIDYERIEDSRKEKT